MKNNSSVDYDNKVLEVKDLRQFFKVGTGSSKILVKAVDGISFDVYKREVFGLVGESGCGKTTTGRTIIRLYNPTDGEVIYNGNVIGAGHEGFAYKAKRIKEKTAHEIMLHKPYKLKKYEITEKYKYDIIDLNYKVKNLKEQYNLDKIEVLSAKTLYQEKLDEIKDSYKSKDADLTHKFNMNKIDILSEGILPILRERKFYIKFIKDRLNDKVKFINELKVERYEKDEQIRLAKEAFEVELETIENRIIKKLDKKNINTENLNYKLLRLEVGIAERKEKRAKINDLSDKLKLDANNLRSEYQISLQNHKNNFYDKDSINQNLITLKNNLNEQLLIIKEKKLNLKVSYKEELNKLKEDLKANPDKYQNNEEAINSLIAKRDEEILVQKNNIRNARIQNSFKELPEQKEIRVNKLNDAKAQFEKDKAELLNKYNNDASNSEYKLELSNLKQNYKKQVIDIKKTKPSHVNYLSTMQMIFQDPISSLNPRMIVSDIVSEGLTIRGVKDKNLIRDKVYETLNLVGLTKDHATRYPHEFSGGQRQRIGIARAIIANPDFIIADEPISALDVSIQAQVINLLNELKEKLGLTILFIAHDLSVVKYFSDRIAVMFMGKIVELASSEELFNNPLHPYTKSLLSAIPQADPESERKRKRVMYDYRLHNYSTDKPEMVEIKKGHFIYANKEEIKNYKKELGL